jgi:outer membrane lipoprotein SlyB
LLLISSCGQHLTIHAGQVQQPQLFVGAGLLGRLLGGMLGNLLGGLLGNMLESLLGRLLGRLLASRDVGLHTCPLLRTIVLVLCCRCGMW